MTTDVGLQRLLPRFHEKVQEHASLLRAAIDVLLPQRERVRRREGGQVPPELLRVVGDPRILVGSRGLGGGRGLSGFRRPGRLVRSAEKHLAHLDHGLDRPHVGQITGTDEPGRQPLDCHEGDPDRRLPVEDQVAGHLPYDLADHVQISGRFRLGVCAERGGLQPSQRGPDQGVPLEHPRDRRVGAGGGRPARIADSPPPRADGSAALSLSPETSGEPPVDERKPRVLLRPEVFEPLGAMLPAIDLQKPARELENGVRRHAGEEGDARQRGLLDPLLEPVKTGPRSQVSKRPVGVDGIPEKADGATRVLLPLPVRESRREFTQHGVEAFPHAGAGLREDRCDLREVRPAHREPKGRRIEFGPFPMDHFPPCRSGSVDPPRASTGSYLSAGGGSLLE